MTRSPSTTAGLVLASVLSAAALGSTTVRAGFSDFPSDGPGSPTPAVPQAEPARLLSFQAGRDRALGTGKATWYGPGFHGRRTASGERFDAGSLTAAHRSLPFGTLVRVTAAASGRSVVVRINDRGPSRRSGAVIDLSRASAQAIGIGGTAQVHLAAVGG